MYGFFSSFTSLDLLDYYWCLDIADFLTIFFVNIFYFFDHSFCLCAIVEFFCSIVYVFFVFLYLYFDHHFFVLYMISYMKMTFCKLSEFAFLMFCFLNFKILT